MNTLFKFFSQVWVIWGVAAAIALPRLWRGFVLGDRTEAWALDAVRTEDEVAAQSVAATYPDEDAVGIDPARVDAGKTNPTEQQEPIQPTEDDRCYVPQRAPAHWSWRSAWSLAFVLLFVASSAYIAWGTPARIEQRFNGWQPEVGTLNGMAFMERGVYTWPDASNPIELQYDWDAIQWLLDNVKGNAVIVESDVVGYYREGGSRVASLTGLSGLRGMHASEQRYGDENGRRDGEHREFWSNPDPARTLELIDELNITFIYVGQLEQYNHPDGVRKLEQMAQSSQLVEVFANERVTIYGVPDNLADANLPLP